MLNKKLTIVPVLAAVIALGSFALTLDDEPTSSHMTNSSYLQNLDEISEIAEYAIIGTVEKMTPVRVDMPKESDEDRVYTDVTIKVKEDLFGKYTDEQISVRILGGQANGFTMTTDFEPKFTIGKDVLVYVSEISDGYTYNDYRFVVGHSQGTFDDNGDRYDNQKSTISIDKTELSNLRSNSGLQ